MPPKFKKAAQKLDSQIFLNKSRILESVSMNQIVIIVGQTGCGKSTQIPQYLYHGGFSRNGIIACLHPRCIAASTLADRVSQETRTALGSLVGYRVRFDSNYSYHTHILYMTTGFMLRLLQEDDEVNKYSVIIIDEAHERSVQNDVLMGRLKMIMKRNKSIKLVIMSATLNTEEIKDFYPGSVTVSIKEVTDQVEVIYRAPRKTKYLDEVKNTVKEILDTTSKGHILVFLPSEEKVRKCKLMLKEFSSPVVLGFYAALDYDDKMMVFKEFGRKRKIILATNIAETSLTIEGVDFVIDSGFVKRIKYDHKNRYEKWVTEKISISEADQRRGRTGRTGPGKCYRLYEDFKNITDKPVPFSELGKLLSKLRQDYPEPEIKYVNLGSIILTLSSLGITDIDKFPFIVKPDSNNVKFSVDHLKELSLLNAEDGTITNLGSQVTRLPLDPIMGKVAVIGSQMSCRREVFIIVAMLSVLNILKTPKAQKSQQCHKQFTSAHGDLFTLLNIYNRASEQGFSKQWCSDYMINYSCLKYARLIVSQLHWLLSDQSPRRDLVLSRSKENQIKKVFLAGFYNNILRRVNDSYQNLAGEPTSIYQSSCLTSSEDLVMGIVLLKAANTKGYVLRNCVTLNIEMLKAFTPQKYKVKSLVWKNVIKKIIGEPDANETISEKKMLPKTTTPLPLFDLDDFDIDEEWLKQMVELHKYVNR